jgi:trehalose-6-phosphate synthase
MPRTLINVSNRLPVTVQEDQITTSSGGLVAALEGFPEEAAAHSANLRTGHSW